LPGEALSAIPAAMILNTLVKANLWAERHRKLVAAVTIAAFAIGCAHYARFIRLPEIVALPGVATGILTGLRYALWDGWLKRAIEARTREAAGEAESLSRPPGQAEARAARRSGARGNGEEAG
jgi:hypothetical protein